MDEYNKTLVEDTSRNRMKESLLLFRMITTKHFADKPVVLLLNKRDLFVEKIQKVDLNVCFPDYTGGCNYEPAAAFIINEFKKVSGPELDGRMLGAVGVGVLVWDGGGTTFASCAVRVHAHGTEVFIPILFSLAVGCRTGAREYFYAPDLCNRHGQHEKDLFVCGRNCDPRKHG